MDIEVANNRQSLDRSVAEWVANLIKQEIAAQGSAAIVLATGGSQTGILPALAAQPGVQWEKVTVFHLDEYIGLPASHPGSFRHYLQERFVGHLPQLGRFVGIEGSAADVEATLEYLAGEIGKSVPAVALLGIGVNGHLAFNEPPADFETERPYIAVDLTEHTRRQQVVGGWFAKLDEVPKMAITMSIRQILKARAQACTAVGAHKAKAVRDAVDGEVAPESPASALQLHDKARLFLDEGASSLLTIKQSEQ